MPGDIFEIEPRFFKAHFMSKIEAKSKPKPELAAPPVSEKELEKTAASLSGPVEKKDEK